MACRRHSHGRLGCRSLHSKAKPGPVTTTGTGEAATEAGGKVADKVGPKQPAAHYSVTIKMDEGKVVTLVMAAEKVTGIKEGSKVALSGDGESAVLKAE